MALETDKEALEAALTTIGSVDSREATIVHIKNTLELAELDISEALLEELDGREDLQLVEELGPLSFGEQGKLKPVSLKGGS